MPLITRPQVYRVVREMLPRERFGPWDVKGGEKVYHCGGNWPASDC